jgi:hypothetical protein
MACTCVHGTSQCVSTLPTLPPVSMLRNIMNHPPASATGASRKTTRSFEKQKHARMDTPEASSATSTRSRSSSRWSQMGISKSSGVSCLSGFRNFWMLDGSSDTSSADNARGNCSAAVSAETETRMVMKVMMALSYYYYKTGSSIFMHSKCKTWGICAMTNGGFATIAASREQFGPTWLIHCCATHLLPGAPSMLHNLAIAWTGCRLQAPERPGNRCSPCRQS